MKRKHINLKTKLASALLALGHIPYEDAQAMGRDNFLRLFTYDHAILHGIEPNDEFWNLTPRLIAEHREKSRKDTSIVAKTKRIEKKWRDFTASMAAGNKPPKKQSKWPKRPFNQKKR